MTHIHEIIGAGQTLPYLRKLLIKKKSDKLASFFDYQQMFILHNENNNHWSFYCVFFAAKTIAYYDSLNTNARHNNDILTLLEQLKTLELGLGLGLGYATYDKDILTLLEQLKTLENGSFNKEEWKLVRVHCVGQVYILLLATLYFSVYLDFTLY